MENRDSMPTPEDHGHILLVDDDPQLRLLVARFLQRYRYQVTAVPDGRVMLDILARSQIDLIILDYMLPGSSGIELCRHVRRTSKIPIVMLTARSDEDDRISGLEVGADDYISKPFSPRELLARIRAVLRRSRATRDDNQITVTEIVTFDNWTLDLRRRELVSPSGVLVDLSTGEFDLLVAFVEHANRVLSREALMQLAKTRAGDQFDRTIDVQISRLRRKLEQDESGSPLIKTVRGVGYLFTPNVRIREGQPA